MNLITFYKKAVGNLQASSSPELDARVLIEHVLSKDAAFVISNPEMPLTNAQHSRLERLINRRAKGEPIAYITGHKEFYGLDFHVNKNVLVPRPESEWLVEQAINSIKSRVHKVRSELEIGNWKLEILDMGTGSGCLIIALTVELEKSFHIPHSTFHFFASDIAEKALAIAKKNARKHDVSREIKFVHSDLFSNRLLHKKFNLIIANLPYVPKQVKSQKLKVKSPIDFEPEIAIFAEDNGGEIIKRFISESKDRLKPNGLILLELDPRNCKEIAKFAKNIFPNATIEVSEDLAKWERYLKIHPER